MGNKNIKIYLPKQVQYIISTLQSSKYEAYIVGGCVRDSLLEKEPKDWDITTNALPHYVVEIFKDLGFKVVPIGIQYGTVTVVIDKENFEITTYRSRNSNEKESFTNSLKEDLCKRDFTINAMAYNDEDGLIDYFSGLENIDNKVIKCVESPLDRFSEDPLRMLRAYRFSAELNFNIEKHTGEWIEKLSSTIRIVSIERIREEFNKILLSDNPKEIHNISACGLLGHFIPEFDICEKTSQDNPHHIYTVGEHIIKTVESIEKKLSLRLTMFLHDICKPQCKTVDDKGIGHFYNHDEVSSIKAEEILKRMKYDNKTIEKVTTLVKYHDRRMEGNKSIRNLLSLIGEDNFRELLKIKEADMMAQNPIYYEENHSKLLQIESKFNDIIRSKQCFTIKDLAVNGKDLSDLGMKEGKEVGIVLNKLLSVVLENPAMNNKKILLNLVRENEMN
ncbi:HD domain-containing protein [Clostridium sp. PL3]|uniref:HD domain-containing protein n=1 Tax=Clostridium thailandense TaxID=2794346 RepID=A0A949WVY9_9CLOT|nr:HD domain-containing protein [Clostridium thailandense]MBV7274207.1 HD domain-containing protein [Clostridium thailandense]